jgi:hypothetical protein
MCTFESHAHRALLSNRLLTAHHAAGYQAWLQGQF